MTTPSAKLSVQRGRYLQRWAALAGVCGLAVWLAWRWHSEGGFHLSEFVHTWTSANWGWLVVSAFAYLAAYWARAERWSVMLRPLRPTLRQSGIFSATAIGFAAIMLMGRPGELVRPYLISVQEKTPLSAQMTIWVLERLYDLFFLLTLFGVAIALVAGRATRLGSTMKWLVQSGGVLAAAIACVCAILLVAAGFLGPQLRDRLSPLLNRLGDRRREVAMQFLNAATGGLTSMRQMSSVVKTLGWSAFHWAVVCFCYVAALKAFPATEGRSMADALVVMAFAAFGSIVQIPGIGGGPQVACTMVLVEMFHLPLETAAGMALVIYLVGFVAIVPLGLTLLAKRGLSLTRLHHLREDIDA